MADQWGGSRPDVAGMVGLRGGCIEGDPRHLNTVLCLDLGVVVEHLDTLVDVAKRAEPVR